MNSKAGDIFRFPINEKEYAFGRILILKALDPIRLTELIGLTQQTPIMIYPKERDMI